MPSGRVWGFRLNLLDRMIRNRFLLLRSRRERTSKGGLKGFGRILDIDGVWDIFIKRQFAFSLLSIDVL